MCSKLCSSGSGRWCIGCPDVAFIPDLQTILDTCFNDAMNKRVYEHSSGLAELAWRRKGFFYAARRPASAAAFD